MESHKAKEQTRRREATLRRQKRRRAQVTHARRAETDDTVQHGAPTPHDDDTQPTSTPLTTSTTPNTPLPHHALPPITAAEWMVDVPDDLARAWMLVVRPRGFRCLVATTGGQTLVAAPTPRGVKGRRRLFQSALPGGSRSSSRASDACELECVRSDDEHTYYVLDVLRWRGASLVDTTAEFRFFWLRARLEESRCGEASALNPWRFVVPPVLSCTADSLRAAHTLPVGYEKDGILFYHREGLYEAGRSPLVLLWGDASCLPGFYDYNTDEMARMTEVDPERARRWRTDSTDAALTLDDLLRHVSGAEDATAVSSTDLEMDMTYISSRLSLRADVTVRWCECS